MKVTTTVAETRKAVEELREYLRGLYGRKPNIGFVPTMGALHLGHIKLVDSSKHLSDGTVVSIFVNPLQFGEGEDFERYPRPVERDLKLLDRYTVDIVFLPEVKEMYKVGADSRVKVEGLSAILEGKSRPGHFEGVATVVLKLFNIVQPDTAYFGQKDYQQYLVIKKMVDDLDLPVEIKMVPTVREEDGLPMSSRNAYLSKEDRELAPLLNRCLSLLKQNVDEGEKNVGSLIRLGREALRRYPQFELDYLEIRDADDLSEISEINGRAVILIAGRIGRTRLVDNLLIGEGRGE